MFSTSLINGHSHLCFHTSLGVVSCEPEHPSVLQKQKQKSIQPRRLLTGVVMHTRNCVLGLRIAYTPHLTGTGTYTWDWKETAGTSLTQQLEDASPKAE